MQDFITKLQRSEFGLSVPYAGGYEAHITPDEDGGGYFISYTSGMMPPHTTDHAANATEAAEKVAEVADLTHAYEIEAD